MAATLKRTALHAGPTVLGIIVLDFLFLQLMPGDAADVIASESGVATAETMAALRERFGLDYFGIDCGLDRDGNLIVFEVNASMLVHDDNAEFPYKDAAVRAIKTAFGAMLRNRAAVILPS